MSSALSCFYARRKMPRKVHDDNNDNDNSHTINDTTTTTTTTTNNNNDNNNDNSDMWFPLEIHENLQWTFRNG